MVSDKSKQNSLEKLMAILFVHSKPEILGVEVKDAIEKISIDKKRLKVYLDTVLDVRYARRKVGRP